MKREQERRADDTHRLLSRLDQVDVPNLWHDVRVRSTDDRRRSTDRREVEGREPRRPAILVAASVLVVSLVAGGLAIVLGGGGSERVRTEHPRTPADQPYVAASMDLPSSFRPGGVLLAPSPDGLWLAEMEGTELLHIVEAEAGALEVDRRVPVDRVVALTSTDGTLWVLTADGELLRLRRKDSDRLEPLDSLGAAANGRPLIQAAGDRLWIANSGRGALIAVDPVERSIVDVPGVGPPATLTTAGTDVWVVDQSTGRVARVDATSAVVAWSGEVGSPAAALADRTGLWFIDSRSGTLSQVSPSGRTVRMAPDASDDSLTSRLAVTSDLVWVLGGEVLQGFDRRGSLRSTVVVPLRSVRQPVVVGSGSTIWVADGFGRSLTLVRGS